MAINDIVQTIAEARVDARSLSEFVFKPAGFKVARRLAPPVDTLQFYIDSFDTYVATIPNIINDAINNTAVEGGVLADTFVTATANGVGSVARTQRDKNADVVSVKDFGAKGDGITDDITAFEAALASGKTIFIPVGTYLVSRGIKLPSNTNMYGAGIDKTIIKPMDSMPVGDSIVFNDGVNTGNENIYISDFTVDGNNRRTGNPNFGGSGGSRDSGVTYRGVVNGSICRIKVYNPSLHGIDITCAGLNYPYNGDTAPNAPLPSRNITVDSCDVSDFGDDGITTHHSEYLFITNNYCHDSRQLGNNNGIELDDGSRHVYLSGNFTERNYGGIEIKAHGNAPAANNVVINGHVSRSDVRSYNFRHIGHHTAADPMSTSAKNITANNLVSINPNNDKGYYEGDIAPSALVIGAYNGVNINNFTAITDDPAKFGTASVISLQYKCRNINISNVSLTGFSLANIAISVNGSSSFADNVNISNVVSKNSGRAVIHVGAQAKNVSISNISGVQTEPLIDASNPEKLPYCVIYAVSSNINLSGVTNSGYPETTILDDGAAVYTDGISLSQNAFRAASSSSMYIHKEGALIATTGGCAATKSKTMVTTSFDCSANTEFGTVIGSFRSSTTGTKLSNYVIGSTNCTATGDRSGVISSRGVKEDGDYRLTGGYGESDPITNEGKTSNIKWQLDSQVGTIKATGAVTGASVFTDYAEYFESLSGQPIASGTLVTLEGEKIRPANSGDVIVGAISETAGVVLGEATWAWHGQYLKNEFGGITDELNPDYVADIDYVSRAERPEWNIVGLMGQLYVRIDESVKVGQGVTANNGIAAIGDTGIVMQIAKPYNKKSGYGVAKLLLK